MDATLRAGVAPGTVTFVGAGPGDPDLMTIKGRKAIEEAALVLYAGSLVPREVVACAAPQAMAACAPMAEKATARRASVASSATPGRCGTGNRPNQRVATSSAGSCDTAQPAETYSHPVSGRPSIKA